ncbi:hypothetical protein CHI95_17590 [Providencia rettgeri]|uniref:Uncharacterized protein n=1 Tax=Providencia rettgeri TaxID=587 RepID=A0A264VPE9_PRORE|nr:hypothetical protein CHI95_17590 [Providencia rettgeri]
MQDLNSTNLAFGLNLQPAYRGMAWRLSVYLIRSWLGFNAEMVGRAGLKFYEFSLRPEPATSLSRYSLATERLLDSELA